MMCGWSPWGLRRPSVLAPIDPNGHDGLGTAGHEFRARVDAEHVVDGLHVFVHRRIRDAPRRRNLLLREARPQEPEDRLFGRRELAGSDGLLPSIAGVRSASSSHRWTSAGEQQSSTTEPRRR